MTSLYYKRDDCRLCGSRDLSLVVPLAAMPIATPNFSVPGAQTDSDIFKEAIPLNLHLCRNCGLLQVLHVGNAEVQYSNYVYKTSFSLGLREHFRGYADDVSASIEPASGSLVVEIGSNDGTLLGFFKEKGLRVLGIDPARRIAAAATEAGIETIAEFFSAGLAAKIRESHGPARIVIANNVIANIDDLTDIMAGIRDLLAPDGVFVFETQYGADVIDHTLLDTVYHEHLSYFNVGPLATYFRRSGMAVIDVKHISTKGGSIRFTVQRAGGPHNETPAVGRILTEEASRGMNEAGFYEKFADHVRAVRSDLVSMVNEHRHAGRTIAGYGVSVGTTTLLAQFDLADKIDVLFDDDTDKAPFLSGPGYDIPVFGPEAVIEKNPALIVVFAWRYAEPIMAKHQSYIDGGGKFVIPLPRIVTVESR